MRERVEVKKDVAAARNAAGLLRARILSGALKPGTPLREAALIQDIGVSRNTLREAFLQLTFEGLTEQQLYKGTVVRQIDAHEARDIFIARRTLEFRAIERSSYATTAALETIRAAIDRAQDAVGRQAWAEAATEGMRFHQAIVALLGSRKLDALFEVLSAQLRLAFSTFTNEGEYQAPWLSRDIEICDLLLSGRRQDARSAMERYLDESEQELLDRLRLSRSQEHYPERE